MQKNLIPLTLAALLAGCSIQNPTLEDQLHTCQEQLASSTSLVNQLQADLAQEKIDRAQHLDEMRQQIAAIKYNVGLTQGCNWFFPACPASVTEPGDTGIKAGYGAALQPFLGIVVAKLILLTGILIGTIWLFLQWYRAQREMVESKTRLAEAESSAEQACKQAEADLANVQTEQTKVEQAVRQTLGQLAQARKDLQKVGARKAKLLQDLDRLQKLQADARDALG